MARESPNNSMDVEPGPFSRNAKAPKAAVHYRESAKPEARPIYALRRLGAIAAIAGVAVVGYKGIYEPVRDELHRQDLIQEYGKPHLADELREDMDNRSDLIFDSVQSDDKNPTQVAERMGALDTSLVATIISKQVGGDKSLGLGESIVIPTEMLQPRDPRD